MERLQVSVEGDCFKMCKLLQAHTGKSISQIGQAALRAYVVRQVIEDEGFRKLALALETTPGSYAHRKMNALREEMGD